MSQLSTFRPVVPARAPQISPSSSRPGIRLRTRVRAGSIFFEPTEPIGGNGQDGGCPLQP